MANKPSFQTFLQPGARQSTVRQGVESNTISNLIKGAGNLAVASASKRPEDDPTIANAVATATAKDPETILRETQAAAQGGGHPGMQDVAGDPIAQAALKEAGIAMGKASLLEKQRGKKRLADLHRAREMRRIMGAFPGREAEVAAEFGKLNTTFNILDDAQADDIAAQETVETRQREQILPMMKSMGFTGTVDQFVARYGDFVQAERSLQLVQQTLDMVEKSTDLSVAEQDAVQVQSLIQGYNKMPMAVNSQISSLIQRAGFAGGTADPSLIAELKRSKNTMLSTFAGNTFGPKAERMSQQLRETTAATYDTAIEFAEGKITLQAYETNNQLQMEIGRSNVLASVPNFAESVFIMNTMSKAAPEWMAAGLKMELTSRVGAPLLHHMGNIFSDGYSPLNSNTAFGGRGAELNDAQAGIVEYYSQLIGNEAAKEHVLPVVKNLMGDIDKVPEEGLATAMAAYSEMLASSDILPVLRSMGGGQPLTAKAMDRMQRYQRGLSRSINGELDTMVVINSGQLPGKEKPISGLTNRSKVALRDAIVTSVTPDGQLRFSVSPALVKTRSGVDEGLQFKVNQLNEELAPRIGSVIRAYTHVQNMNQDYATGYTQMQELGLLKLVEEESKDGD